MFRAKLSVVSRLTLVGVALLATACSSTPEDKAAGQSPNKIYADAKEDMNAGAYDKAIAQFEKLEGRAAGTPLAQQAQLEKAFAYFKTGETAQAISTLDRFMKLHPASPALDYALYLKGLVSFNDDLGMFAFITRQDLAERDQKAAKESFEAFKELTTRFPTSRYTPDATQRMTYIVNALARYEVHVARFYYSRGAYVAAINRAQSALADYQGVSALEDALFIMVQSYDALGMTQLRDDAKRVMALNYPKSELLSQGRRTNTNPWWRFW